MQTNEATSTPAPDVLAGLIDRETLSEQLGGVSERTIQRYERDGLPFIAIGVLRRYDPASVRDWVLTKERSHSAPKRGRPAKRAA